MFISSLIAIVMQLLTILIIVHVVLSYFMDPFHPVRQAVDRIVEPMLAPIRQLVPPVGGIDFSPIVFLLLVQLIGNVLVNLIN
ncbi:MAG: YggT family protein [Anaerolineales bacterium]|nr:YggT family protein [Anaerolineales bacterium]